MDTMSILYTVNGYRLRWALLVSPIISHSMKVIDTVYLDLCSFCKLYTANTIAHYLKLLVWCGKTLYFTYLQQIKDIDHNQHVPKPSYILFLCASHSCIKVNWIQCRVWVSILSYQSFSVSHEGKKATSCFKAMTWMNACTPDFQRLTWPTLAF